MAQDRQRKDRIRYRRVSTRMWNDEKFLALSKPQPNGRDLWTWLIAGPLTTPVPGVVIATMGGMADRLGWPLPATRRCWQEIADKAMAVADWENSLIWLPRALRHNPPESPNVVKSWRKYLDEHVPECQLRADLEGYAQAFFKGLGEGFAEGFGQPFGQGRATPFGESGNREQGSGSTPQPPSTSEGGRVTRAERAHAERVRATHGGCPHSPKCVSTGECVGVLVGVYRRDLEAGLREGLS